MDRRVAFLILSIIDLCAFHSVHVHGTQKCVECERVYFLLVRLLQRLNFRSIEHDGNDNVFGLDTVSSSS